VTATTPKPNERMRKGHPVPRAVSQRRTEE
jgi:hypothetical protein